MSVLSLSEGTCNACRGHTIEAATAGVTVTLIDFTLSRLTAVTGDVAFCNLAADPELFQGPKGDVQVCTQTSDCVSGSATKQGKTHEFAYR